MAHRTDFRVVVPHQGVEQVAARLDIPSETEAPRAVFVLAHGSGAPLTSDFLEEIAPRIADAGDLAVLRFNYAYAELMVRSGKPRPPERRAGLDAVHRALLAHARESFPDLPLIGGGKSLGGRIASLLAADGEPMAGLCFLGYPLHPPGREERPRTEHFPKLDLPAIFLQGTRDALCNMELLEPALELWRTRPALHRVDAADHGFSVLRRSGRDPEAVLAEIAGAVGAWARERF